MMREIWIVSVCILFHRIHGQTMELIAGHVVCVCVFCNRIEEK